LARWSTYRGHGFNTIWRPHQVGLAGKPPNQDRILELNLTQETLEFTRISNRGFLEPDIDLFGVTYLQQISDRLVKVGIHAEPGVWATVPATQDPAEAASVVRMASIPHGTTINAQGKALTNNSPPDIKGNNITSFTIGNPANLIQFPETKLDTPTKFRLPQPPLLAEITQQMVDNPNFVLTDAIKGHNITKTTTLIIATSPALPPVGGGTDNIAFLQGVDGKPNADAAQMTATF
jgi:hypothetical protein